MTTPQIASKIFTLQSGYGKVLVMSHAEDTDSVLVMYHPDRDATEDALVPLVVEGSTVTLTAAAPMTTLVLPGAYQVVPVGTLSAGARVSTSDGGGFPVNLTVEVKNVAG